MEERHPSQPARAPARALRLAVALLAALLAAAAAAPAPDVEWAKTYGWYNANDVPTSVLQAPDGGYLVAGRSNPGPPFGFGNYDIWLVRTDASGTALWNRTYGGSKWDVMYNSGSLAQASDGGYVLAGETTSYGAGNSDFWLLKTDASGSVVLNRTFGGSGTEFATAVRQTPDGGYIMAGGGGGNGCYDAWLIKANSSGAQQWKQNVGGAGCDGGSDVLKAQCHDGYVAVGTTASKGAGKEDVWAGFFDLSGTLKWEKTFGGIGFDRANAVLQTSDCGWLIVGYTNSSGAGGYDFWLIKLDAEANKQWDRTYGGSGDEKANGVAKAADGGFVVVGETSSYGAGGSDAWIVRTDASGNPVWNKTLGGPNADVGRAVRLAADGGYIIAADTKSYGAGNEDFWLVKLLPEPAPDKATLLSLSFDDTLNGADGESPSVANGYEYAPGISGKGVKLDGSDVLRYPWEGNVHPPRGTIELWVEPLWDEATAPDDNRFLFQAIPFEGGTEVKLFRRGGEGVHELRLNLIDRNGVNKYVSAPISGWKAGEWHHVAAAWDVGAAGSGWMRIYADGLLADEKTSLTLSMGALTTTPLRVGCDAYNEKYQPNAVLDELRVLNYPMTSAEVSSRFYGMRPPPILVTPPSGFLPAVNVSVESCPEGMARIDAYWGSYCIDKYEAYDAGSGKAGSAPGKQPWVNINWNDAKTACIAAGKRLCKDIESVVPRLTRRDTQLGPS